MLVKPRPLPERTLPTLAGAGVVALALPLFLLVGWSLRGWAFGALLWAASLVLELVFRRVGIPGQPSVRGSGIVAFGMMSRGIVLMVVAFAVAASEPEVGVPGALLYAAAYTLELVLSLAAFFSGDDRA